MMNEKMKARAEVGDYICRYRKGTSIFRVEMVSEHGISWVSPPRRLTGIGNGTSEFVKHEDYFIVRKAYNGEAGNVLSSEVVEEMSDYIRDTETLDLIATIRHLQKVNERFGQALSFISDIDGDDYAYTAVQVARDALEGKS